MKSPFGVRVKAVKKCLDCLQKLNVLQRGNSFREIPAHSDRCESQVPAGGDTFEVQITGPRLRPHLTINSTPKASPLRSLRLGVLVGETGITGRYRSPQPGHTRTLPETAPTKPTRPRSTWLWSRGRGCSRPSLLPLYNHEAEEDMLTLAPYECATRTLTVNQETSVAFSVCNGSLREHNLIPFPVPWPV